MKSILLLLLFIPGFSIAQIDKTGLEFFKMGEDLYVYTTYQEYAGTPFPSNSMYWVTDQGVVLIDTPWDPGQFQPLLDSIQSRHGLPVIMTLSTHFHEDRTGGVEYYRNKGISTYTSKLTHELSVEKNFPLAEFHFSGDTTFVFGGQTMEVIYPGKGHTSDNLVVWFGDQKLLFGGCLVKSPDSPAIGNIADASLEDWGPSIRRLIALFPDREIVIPGHLGWNKNTGLEHTLDVLKNHRKNKKIN